MPGVRDVLPVWVVLLVVARELIVTALRAAVERVWTRPARAS